MDCRVKPGNDACYGSISGGAGVSARVAPSDVPQGREHPGVEAVEQVAVERPKPRVVGIEGDHDPAAGRDQHRVAHRAGKALAVYLDTLKFVPVQVHRMRHWRLIDEDQLDALALGD